MKRLIALLFLLVPMSLGCSNSDNHVTVICEGVPPSGAKYLNGSNYNAPFYKVQSDVDGKVYYIPVQKCILVEQ